MSLLGKIAKIGKSVLKSPIAKVATRAIPGVGQVLGAVGVASSVADVVKAVRPAAKALPAIGGSGVPILPTLSSVALGGAGAAAGGAVASLFGTTHKRRRRRKGITAKDLNSFKRVAKLVDKYAKPVHHMRNFKK